MAAQLVSTGVGEYMQDLVIAALEMQRAMELDADEPQWRSERDRLLPLIPEKESGLLQACSGDQMSLCQLSPDVDQDTLYTSLTCQCTVLRTGVITCR